MSTIGYARGFSLIELMIVVAIVAVIAAVAVPGYQNSIRKTNRQDARETLVDFATRQEKFRLTNSRYAAPNEYASKLRYSTANSFVSKGGYYSVTPGSTFCPDADESCYAAIATATGSQLADDSCRYFAILSDGRRGSKNAVAGASWRFGANDECW